MNDGNESFHPRHLAEFLWLEKLLAEFRESPLSSEESGEQDLPEKPLDQDPQEPLESPSEENRPEAPLPDSPSQPTVEPEAEPEQELLPGEEVVIQEDGSVTKKSPTGVPTSSQSHSIPSLAPLENPLGYSRALHRLVPLKEIPGVQEIDIDQTVKFSAAAGKGIHPVLVEKRERKGHLVIIEATGLAQAPWKSTIRRLEQIARAVGSYRDVQRVPLDLEALESTENTNQELENSLRLALRPGRPTMVLLIHDGVDDTIEDGRLGSFLERQIRRVDNQAKLAWLHPWPKKYWSSTAVEGLFRRGLGNDKDEELILPVLPLGLDENGRPGLTHLERWLDGIAPDNLPAYGIPTQTEDSWEESSPEDIEIADIDWHEKIERFVLSTSNAGARLLSAAGVASGVAAISVPFLEVLCSIDMDADELKVEESRFAVASALTSGFFEKIPVEENEFSDLIRLRFRAGVQKHIQKMITNATIRKVVERIRSDQFEQKAAHYQLESGRNLVGEINWNYLKRVSGGSGGTIEGAFGPQIDPSSFMWVAKALGHEEEEVIKWIEADPNSFYPNQGVESTDGRHDSGQEEDQKQEDMSDDVYPLGIDDPTLKKYLQIRGKVTEQLEFAKADLTLIQHFTDQKDPFASLEELFERDTDRNFYSTNDYSSLLSRIPGWGHRWGLLVMGPHRKGFVEVFQLYATLIAHEWIWILNALEKNLKIREHYFVDLEESKDEFNALLELKQEFKKYSLRQVSASDIAFVSQKESNVYGYPPLRTFVAEFKQKREKLNNNSSDLNLPPHLEIQLANDLLQETSIHQKDKIYWSKESASSFFRMMLDFLPIEELVKRVCEAEVQAFPTDEDMPIWDMNKESESLNYVRLLAVAVKDILPDLINTKVEGILSDKFVYRFPEVGAGPFTALTDGDDPKLTNLDGLCQIFEKLGDNEIWPSVSLNQFLYSDKFTYFTTETSDAWVSRSPTVSLYKKLRILFNRKQSANYYSADDISILNGPGGLQISLVSKVKNIKAEEWYSLGAMIENDAYLNFIRNQNKQDPIVRKSWYTEGLKNNSIKTTGSFLASYLAYVEAYGCDPRIKTSYGFSNIDGRYTIGDTTLHAETHRAILNLKNRKGLKFLEIMEPWLQERYEDGLGYAAHLLRFNSDRVIPGRLHYWFFKIPDWISKEIEKFLKSYQDISYETAESVADFIDFQSQNSDKEIWDPLVINLPTTSRPDRLDIRYETLNIMPHEIGLNPLGAFAQTRKKRIDLHIIESYFQELILVEEFLNFTKNRQSVSLKPSLKVLRVLQKLCEEDCLSALKAIYLSRPLFERSMKTLRNELAHSSWSGDSEELYQAMESLEYFESSNFDVLEKFHHSNYRNSTPSDSDAGLIGSGLECRWLRSSIEARVYELKTKKDYFESDSLKWNPYGSPYVDGFEDVDTESLDISQVNTHLHWNLSVNDSEKRKYAKFLIEYYFIGQSRTLMGSGSPGIFHENGLPDYDLWLKHDFWRTVYLDCLLLDRSSEILTAMGFKADLANESDLPSVQNSKTEMPKELKVKIGDLAHEWLLLRCEYPDQNDKGRIEIHWSPVYEGFKSETLHTGWKQKSELSYCSLEFGIDPFISLEFYVMHLIEGFEALRDEIKNYKNSKNPPAYLYKRILPGGAFTALETLKINAEFVKWVFESAPNPLWHIDEWMNNDEWGLLNEWLEDKAEEFPTLFRESDHYPKYWSAFLIADFKTEFEEILTVLAQVVSIEWVWLIEEWADFDYLASKWDEDVYDLKNPKQEFMDEVQEFKRFISNESIRLGLSDSGLSGSYSCDYLFNVNEPQNLRNQVAQTIQNAVLPGLVSQKNPYLQSLEVKTKENKIWKTNSLFDELLCYLDVKQVNESFDNIDPFSNKDIGRNYLQFLALHLRHFISSNVSIEIEGEGSAPGAMFDVSLGGVEEDNFIYGTEVGFRWRSEILRDVLDLYGQVQIWPGVTLLDYLKGYDNKNPRVAVRNLTKLESLEEVHPAIRNTLIAYKNYVFGCYLLECSEEGSFPYHEDTIFNVLESWNVNDSAVESSWFMEILYGMRRGILNNFNIRPKGEREPENWFTEIKKYEEKEDLDLGDPRGLEKVFSMISEQLNGDKRLTQKLPRHLFNPDDLFLSNMADHEDVEADFIAYYEPNAVIDHPLLDEIRKWSKKIFVPITSEQKRLGTSRPKKWLYTGAQDSGALAEAQNEYQGNLSFNQVYPEDLRFDARTVLNVLSTCPDSNDYMPYSFIRDGAKGSDVSNWRATYHVSRDKQIHFLNTLWNQYDSSFSESDYCKFIGKLIFKKSITSGFYQTYEDSLNPSGLLTPNTPSAFYIIRDIGGDYIASKLIYWVRAHGKDINWLNIWKMQALPGSFDRAVRKVIRQWFKYSAGAGYDIDLGSEEFWERWKSEPMPEGVKLSDFWSGLLIDVEVQNEGVDESSDSPSKSIVDRPEQISISENTPFSGVKVSKDLWEVVVKKLGLANLRLLDQHQRENALVLFSQNIDPQKIVLNFQELLLDCPEFSKLDQHPLSQSLSETFQQLASRYDYSIRYLPDFKTEEFRSQVVDWDWDFNFSNFLQISYAFQFDPWSAIGVDELISLLLIPRSSFEVGDDFAKDLLIREKIRKLLVEENKSLDFGGSKVDLSLVSLSILFDAMNMGIYRRLFNGVWESVSVQHQKILTDLVKWVRETYTEILSRAGLDWSYASLSNPQIWGEFLMHYRRELRVSGFTEIFGSKESIPVPKSLVDKQGSSSPALSGLTSFFKIHHPFWSAFLSKGQSQFSELKYFVPGEGSPKKRSTSASETWTQVDVLLGHGVHLILEHYGDYVRLVAKSKNRFLDRLLVDRDSFESEVGVPEDWFKSVGKGSQYDLLPADIDVQKTWTNEQLIVKSLQLFKRLRSYLLSRMPSDGN